MLTKWNTLREKERYVIYVCKFIWQILSYILKSLLLFVKTRSVVLFWEYNLLKDFSITNIILQLWRIYTLKIWCPLYLHTPSFLSYKTWVKCCDATGGVKFILHVYISSYILREINLREFSMLVDFAGI